MSLRFIFYLLLIGTGAIVGLWKYRQLSAPFRFLTLLLVVTLISEVTGRYLYFTDRFTMPVYHFLVPVQVLMQTAIYVSLFRSWKGLRYLLLIPSFAVLVFTITNSIFFQPLHSFPSNGVLMLSVLILMYVLFQYKLMLQFPTKQILLKQPVFWLNTGNLLFQSTTFFIWGIYNQIIQAESLPIYLHHVIFIANIILYGSFVSALCLEIWGKSDSFDNEPLHREE